jgi:DNA-binding GntR family transcriptional regulator
MSGGSAGSRVVNGLRERLRTGTISPGTVLSQADIAAEYRVSRIPVRDALRVLASEGLVIRGVSSAIVAGQSIPCAAGAVRDARGD